MTDHPAYFSPIAASLGRSGFSDRPPGPCLAVDGRLLIQTSVDIDLDAAARTLFITFASQNGFQPKYAGGRAEEWAAQWDDGHVTSETKEYFLQLARKVIDTALAKVTR